MYSIFLHLLFTPLNNFKQLVHIENFESSFFIGGEIYYSPVVEIGVNRDLIISKLEVTVVVCYVSNEVPCIIRKTATMWPKFVLRAYTNTASDDECSLKLSLNANKAPSSLSTLFQGN